MKMEVAESQNTAMTSKPSKGLREHMMAKERQNSFDDLFKEGHAFPNSNLSSGNLFEDFDDPFEDERDQATTVTPVEKPEHSPQEVNASPKGVDETDFDPFAGLESTSNSFYKNKGFDGIGSSSDDENREKKPESPLQKKLQKLKEGPSHYSRAGWGDSKDLFKTVSPRGRRSTMSHFTPVSSLALMSGNPRKNQDENSIRSMRATETDKRACFNRRASSSSLSLSNHSSHSAQSDTTGMVKPALGGAKSRRRGGRRPNTDPSGGDSTNGFSLSSHSSHSKTRPSWGRRASTSNLGRGGGEAMSSGFVAPSTPCTVPQKVGAPKLMAGLIASPSPQNLFSPAGTRRASMGMVATPKRPVRMMRRASVANALGNEPKTPSKRLQRRASVATGLSDDPSTPMAKMRVRIRQQRKETSRDCTDVPPKVDEETVRRLVKEHLAKERLRKKQEQSEKNENDSAETEEEDDSDRSGSDDESCHSFEDDASASSYSSRSSTGSRWEDDALNADDAPRMLSRNESNDGETLLAYAQEFAASRNASTDTAQANDDSAAATKSCEEQKTRKKSKKSKKEGKDKKEKKPKKDKKEKKKKCKSKSKSKSQDENSEINGENTVEREGEVALDPAAADENEDSAKSKSEKKSKKSKRKEKKGKKVKAEKPSSEQENDCEDSDGSVENSSSLAETAL